MPILTCENLSEMTGRLVKHLILQMQINSSSSHKLSSLELGYVLAHPSLTAPYTWKPWLQVHVKKILSLHIPFK